MPVTGHFSQVERNRFLAAMGAWWCITKKAYRNTPLKVGEGKSGNTIAAISSPNQSIQSIILVNKKQSSITECPVFRLKVSCKEPYFTKVWVGGIGKRHR